MKQEFDCLQGGNCSISSLPSLSLGGIGCRPPDRERTQAVLLSARGRMESGPKTLDKKKQDPGVKLYHQKEHTLKKLCHVFSISKQTLYNIVAEHVVQAK